jgi:hypothetical protein
MTVCENLEMGAYSDNAWKQKEESGIRAGKWTSGLGRDLCPVFGK